MRDIDELIAAGYVQISRKYRRIGRATAEESNPFWSSDSIDLTPSEFAAYREKTGKKGWLPKGEACWDCGSLGHRHSKECKNQ